ncbi:hypothetical protein HK102_004465, partial [Quaeritorhiza haematococci]
LTGSGSLELELEVPVSKVDLWWPAGYGRQPLYDLTITLTTSSTSIAKSTRRIGFRTARLVQERYKDGRPGTSFRFEINGIKVFAKGTNWIPADCFESRVTGTVLRQQLESCVEANMNMVRVWGGGIYQQDAFYNLCDELGLMVWQEFMFACAMYPVDAAFLDNVREEAEHQVKRLMHHPSIVLWSGNNENEEALVTGWYEPVKKNPFVYTVSVCGMGDGVVWAGAFLLSVVGVARSSGRGGREGMICQSECVDLDFLSSSLTHPKKVDYHRLYHETIMPVVKQLDKTRAFISSSPYNGVISGGDPFTERYVADDKNNDAWGDVHYYNYKDNGLDVTKFRSPRFMSGKHADECLVYANFEGECGIIGKRL